jgi:signal peptidase I
MSVHLPPTAGRAPSRVADAASGPSSAPAPAASSFATLRTLSELVLLLLIALLVARTWLLEGFVVPSGSMAETLCGDHRRVQCQQCQFEFACGSDQPATPTALCPNCASDQTPLESAPEVRGDRVLVAKSAFQFRDPQRYEVVAFRRQQESGRVYVKRVVGLPGEQIQIQGGDLFINGVIQRKTLPQQRALAILVHDASFAPAIDLFPPRWSSHDEAANQPRSRWQSQALPFTHPQADDPNVDWLTYQHVARAPGFASLIHPAPIQDDYGYNQRGSARGDLTHAVRDLLLDLQIAAQGPGTLHFRYDDGRDRLTWLLQPARQHAQLFHNDREVADFTAPLLTRLASGCRLEFSVIDRQCLLAVDQLPLGPPYSFDSIDLPTAPPSRPLAVGAQQMAVEISSLRVFRDVYYTRPRSLKTWGFDQPYQLNAGEYFVLGDNSPQSDDSRLWPEGPAVRQELLVGKPLCVHVPSRASATGWGYIQVPDLRRVGYIR